MSCIGACTFWQLPAEYQELFGTGADRISDGTYVAEKHPGSALLGLPIVWLFASIPAIFVHDHGLSFWSLWGLLSLIPPVLVAALTLIRIRSLVELIRSHRAGARTYGIVLDEHNLVSRSFHLLPVRSCVLVPRGRINALNIQKAVGHPSKYGRSSSLWVNFTDEQGKRSSLMLAQGNSHELRPDRLRETLVALGAGPAVEEK